MIVQIPEDIFVYEHKAWGNFTVRQLLCVSIALAVTCAVFIPVFWKTNNPRLATFLASSAGLPILYCAIWKKDGQYLEKVLWYRYRQRFKFPQKRKYVMTNLYEAVQQNQKEYESAYEECEKQKRQGKKKGRFEFLPTLAQKGHRSKQHSV